MKKISKITLATVSAALGCSFAQANVIGLYDENFSIFNGATKITAGVFEARWGTYANNVFTPFFGTNAVAQNAGYVDVETPEFVTNLSQLNNNTVAAGTPLFLAVTLLADGAAYASSNTEAILSDPTWVAPTFVSTPTPFISVFFTANTTALKGQYSFNSGNEIINLTSTVIPEPSSFAALAGLAVVGMAATRRRRSA